MEDLKPMEGSDRVGIIMDAGCNACANIHQHTVFFQELDPAVQERLNQSTLPPVDLIDKKKLQVWFDAQKRGEPVDIGPLVAMVRDGYFDAQPVPQTPKEGNV